MGSQGSEGPHLAVLKAISASPGLGWGLPLATQWEARGQGSPLVLCQVQPEVEAENRVQKVDCGSWRNKEKLGQERHTLLFCPWQFPPDGVGQAREFWSHGACAQPETSLLCIHVGRLLTAWPGTGEVTARDLQVVCRSGEEAGPSGASLALARGGGGPRESVPPSVSFHVLTLPKNPEGLPGTSVPTARPSAFQRRGALIPT